VSLAADTSILVPALLSYHDAHAVCDQALSEADSALGHVVTEAYSVLTSLPHPFRVEPQTAASSLAERIPPELLALDGASLRDLPKRLAAGGISGGSVYDGLIALTAARHGTELISRDRRATRTYAALGVRYRLIGA
jgi:predicted nucleic acid-binding protein